MGKGEETRQAVLERGVELSRVIGLEGLSIGRLAEELALSKSGLFAHFRSKETLQLEVIQEARRQFTDRVIAPALKKPRGEPRVRALVDLWIEWGAQPGGCFWVAVTAELDDREGPLRVAAMAAERDWLDMLAQAAQIAVDEGHFVKGLDTHQFAFELYGLMLGCHFYDRFMRDRAAVPRTRRALNALIERSRR